jgi:hypothetical protein
VDNRPKATASVEASKVIVHILWRGEALCGFARGKSPAKWEPGHVWARAANAKFCNCGDCMKKATTMPELHEQIIAAAAANLQKPERLK